MCKFRLFDYVFRCDNHRVSGYSTGIRMRDDPIGYLCSAQNFLICHLPELDSSLPVNRIHLAV